MLEENQRNDLLPVVGSLYQYLGPGFFHILIVSILERKNPYSHYISNLMGYLLPDGSVPKKIYDVTWLAEEEV